MMCNRPRCVFVGYFNTFARMLNRWYHCWLVVLGFHNGLSARDGGFAKPAHWAKPRLGAAKFEMVGIHSVKGVQ